MATLITGGTGFIGAEVVRLLLDRGEQRPVVFHVSGNTRRLDDVADQAELVRGDLSNFSHVLDVVKKVKPSVIYHLGAMLSVPSDADPSAAFHVNAMGTFHVLEAARLFDVPQVLFSSSISTYGLDFEGEVIDDTTIQRPVLQAPLGNIKSVNYLLAGIDPIASAGELADMVRARVPGAQIDFQPNPALYPILAKLTVRFDDRRAREEWNWAPHYTQEQIVDDFLSEMRLHAHRYA